MAVEYQLPGTVRFGGLNQQGDDLTRPPEVAEESYNISSLEGGDEKTARKGYQWIADNAGNNGGFGLFLYTPPIGASEVLAAGSKLLRRETGNIDITYTGSGNSVSYSLYVLPDNSGLWFSLVVDGTEVLGEDLGQGYEEGSYRTVEDLKDLIDGLADFAATLTGPISAPAACIPQMINEPIIDGAHIIEFYYLEEVNHPTGAPHPFQGSLDNRANSCRTLCFVNVSSRQALGNIYFANGFDEMQKYDGATCYRAGLPQGALTSVSDAAGAVGTGGSDKYYHAITYVQVDNQGNEIEGIISDQIETDITEESDFTLTIPTLQPSSGFLTDCAVVDGAQTTVTEIDVDTGHSLKVGQTAYFYDGVSASYVQRLIEAVTATTITIAGDAVTVADEAVISANLRVRIWRTAANGTVLGQVADIPHDSINSTQTFVDDVLDSALGAFYLEPEFFGREHGLPPKFRYLSSYKNLTIGLGDLNNQTWGYFSEQNNPEYWPAAHVFFASNDSNEPITGGAENGNSLWIFRKSSIRSLVGDLWSGQFDIIDVSNRVGCENHGSIIRYDTAIAWVGGSSVYVSENGGAPIDIGQPVRRIFQKIEYQTERQIRLRRCVGVLDGQNSTGIWFIPTESDTGSEKYANQYSKTIAYDFLRREWQQWTGLNMAGGVIVDGADLYFMERDFDFLNTNMAYKLAKRHNTGTQFDYVDHRHPIECFYRSGWIHGGVPSMDKTFTSLKLYTNNSLVTSTQRVAVETEINFLQGIAHSRTEFQFDNGGDPGWEVGPWGSFSWGSPSGNAIQYFRLRPFAARSMRPVFRFEVFYNYLALTAWEVEVAPTNENKMVR